VDEEEVPRAGERGRPKRLCEGEKGRQTKRLRWEVQSLPSKKGGEGSGSWAILNERFFRELPSEKGGEGGENSAIGQGKVIASSWRGLWSWGNKGGERKSDDFKSRKNWWVLSSIVRCQGWKKSQSKSAQDPRSGGKELRKKASEKPAFGVEKDRIVRRGGSE